MKQININIAVDVVKALSYKSLENCIFLMDNSPYNSKYQGTENLITSCKPGQTIHWLVYAIDLQTPVAIKNICFLPAIADAENNICYQSELTLQENPDLKTWTGILPCIQVGKNYHYRIELQMGIGKNSIIGIDSPALIYCNQPKYIDYKL